MTFYVLKGMIAFAWFGVLLAATRPERRVRQRNRAAEAPMMAFTPSTGDPFEPEAVDS